MEFKNMIEKLFDAGKVYFEKIKALPHISEKFMRVLVISDVRLVNIDETQQFFRAVFFMTSKKIEEHAEDREKALELLDALETVYAEGPVECGFLHRNGALFPIE